MNVDMLRSPIRSGSWSASLESWARARYGEQMLAVSTTLDFAPLGTLRPQTFYDLPVVLLVMSRRTEALHRALAESVELIREATYGFRVVVLTDAPGSEAFREVDFTVEHLLGESQWAALHGSNWLPAAVDHLEWARWEYGASMVLAPESPEQVDHEVARLCAAFRAPQKVETTAAQLARELVPASLDAGAVETSLRGWWDMADQGRIQRHVELGEHSLEVMVEPGVGAGAGVGVLIGVSAESASLLDGAAAVGFTTVEIIPGPAGGNPAGERLLAGCVRAAAEALGGAGPALLWDPRGEGISDPVEAGVDGVITATDDGAREVSMDYGSSLRCPDAELVPALQQLSRLHLSTAT